MPPRAVGAAKKALGQSCWVVKRRQSRVRSGQEGEPRPIVARQPARARTVPRAFERLPQPQGDDLTGPEAGLGVFGQGAQLLIDLRAQRGEKLYGGHTALLAWV